MKFVLALAMCVFVPGVSPAASERPARLEHWVDYSSQGSRSEAVHGHLSAGGAEVPWGFVRVGHGGKSYRMRYRHHLWGSDGYHPETPAVTPERASASLTELDRERGYVIAERRPADTPHHWIFVEWSGDRRAFVAPAAVGRLIREQGIALGGDMPAPGIRPMPRAGFR